jgi:hypothetical protein
VNLQGDPEIQKIQAEIDQNHLRLEGAWSEFREKVRDGAVNLSRDPEFAKRAFIVAGAMVVLGLFLFYDRGSKA